MLIKHRVCKGLPGYGWYLICPYSGVSQYNTWQEAIDAAHHCVAVGERRL